MTKSQGKHAFVYDGLSRLRISRYYVRQSNGTLVKQNEKRRVYDGMDVVQELNQYGVVTASYTRTGNIGGILARTSSTGSVFYGYDAGGNVVTLTNSSGAEVGSYTYDAFGNTVAQSGWAAIDNPYRFSTKEQIGGLYSYGLRFYSPGLGRWINRDPIGEEGGTNLYMFAGNDPVNSGDEYGLFDIKKAINDWIFGSSDKPCIEDEWDEVGYTSERRTFAGKKAAQSWSIGAQSYMALAPIPGASVASRAMRGRPYKGVYTAASRNHVYQHKHAANAVLTAGKSRFRVGEGGAKFTREVLTHPNRVQFRQGNGNINVTVPDMGRVTGTSRAGNPTRGGQVILQGNPSRNPLFNPRDVVTQYPF